MVDNEKDPRWIWWHNLIGSEVNSDEVADMIFAVIVKAEKVRIEHQLLVSVLEKKVASARHGGAELLAALDVLHNHCRTLCAAAWHDGDSDAIARWVEARAGLDEIVEKTESILAKHREAPGG